MRYSVDHSVLFRGGEAMKKFSLLLMYVFFFISYSAYGQAPSEQSSVYTDLSSDKYKTIDSNEDEDFSIELCPGIAGYKLEVDYGDARETVTVIAADGKKYPLDFMNLVTPYFSNVGKKAEWRVINKDNKMIPTAIIIRLNSTEDGREKSRLTVTKVSLGQICLTDVIEPVANQNQKARDSADLAGGKACLTPKN